MMTSAFLRLLGLEGLVLVFGMTVVVFLVFLVSGTLKVALSFLLALEDFLAGAFSGWAVLELTSFFRASTLRPKVFFFLLISSIVVIMGRFFKRKI